MLHGKGMTCVNLPNPRIIPKSLPGRPFLPLGCDEDGSGAMSLGFLPCLGLCPMATRPVGAGVTCYIGHLPFLWINARLTFFGHIQLPFGFAIPHATDF